MRLSLIQTVLDGVGVRGVGSCAVVNHLQKLLHFVRREGHARVPWNHVEHGVKIGSWVRQKRVAHRRGNLPKELRATLEALPGWTWRVSRSGAISFAHGLDALRRYVAREGHARVPPSHVEEAVRLGVWVGRQRETFKRGRLSLDHVRALEALPGWSWCPLEEDFAQGLARLRLYVAREGHAMVSFSHREGEFPLGQWVGRRREAYRASRIPAEQAKTLEGVPGWAWRVSATPGPWFEQCLEALKGYVVRAGHARVPRTHREESRPLGFWVATLRAR